MEITADCDTFMGLIYHEQITGLPMLLKNRPVVDPHIVRGDQDDGVGMNELLHVCPTAEANKLAVRKRQPLLHLCQPIACKAGWAHNGNSKNTERWGGIEQGCQNSERDEGLAQPHSERKDSPQLVGIAGASDALDDVGHCLLLLDPENSQKRRGQPAFPLQWVEVHRGGGADKSLSRGTRGGRAWVA